MTEGFGQAAKVTSSIVVWFAICAPRRIVMQLNALFPRTNHARSIFDLGIVALSVLLLVGVVLTEQGTAQRGFQGRLRVTTAEPTGGVYLPTDRSLSRAIVR